MSRPPSSNTGGFKLNRSNNFVIMVRSHSKRTSLHLSIFLSLTIIVLYPISTTNSAPFSGLLARHGEMCNSSIPCDPKALLECLGNTCQCESPSNQRFIQKLNLCVSIVGGQCTPTPITTSAMAMSLLPSSELVPSANTGLSTTTTTAKSASRVRQCISNAICVPVQTGTGTNGATTAVHDSASPSGSIFAECRCMDGFIENVSGFCVPGIGQPCNYGPDECNPLGMVMCKNGRCACLDKLQVYDSETKRCVSPAGTHCKFESLQLGCVKNALCYPFYYWVPSRCLCKPGFRQTIERTCVKEEELEKKDHVEDL